MDGDEAMPVTLEDEAAGPRRFVGRELGQGGGGDVLVQVDAPQFAVGGIDGEDERRDDHAHPDQPLRPQPENTRPSRPGRADDGSSAGASGAGDVTCDAASCARLSNM